MWVGGGRSAYEFKEWDDLVGNTTTFELQFAYRYHCEISLTELDRNISMMKFIIRGRRRDEVYQRLEDELLMKAERGEVYHPCIRWEEKKRQERERERSLRRIVVTRRQIFAGRYFQIDDGHRR